MVRDLWNKRVNYLSIKQKKYAQELVARKWRMLPCSPFVGSAPFVLCDNCLQLLLIPGTLFTTGNKKMDSGVVPIPIYLSSPFA